MPLINLEDEEFKFFFLENCLVAPFDIFWIKKSGKKTKVVSHGSVLSKSELTRWTQSKLNLEIKSICSPCHLSNGLLLLTEFEEISKNKFSSVTELSLWRKQFLDWVFNRESKSKLSSIRPIDLSCLFGFFFGDLPEVIQSSFDKLPEKVQSKNLASAAIAIVLALLVGYQDLKFLRELYSVLVLMDYPFSQKTLSSQDSNDLKSLMSKTIKADTEQKIKLIYTDHVKQGVEMLKQELQYKSLADYLNWSFERFNGNGLLLNLNQNEMSDLDSIVIYSHALFPFETINSKNELIVNDLWKLMKRSNGSFYSRLADYLKSSPSDKEDESEYLKIVGL